MKATKMYQLLVSLLTTIMLLVAAFWLVAAVNNLQNSPILLGFLGSILLAVACKWPAVYKRFYSFLIRFKFLWLIAVVIYQVVIIVATNVMIRSDAAIIFNGAMKLEDVTRISLYLSRNSNNMVLFLYERFFYNQFGMNAIWVMQGLNIVYAVLPAFLLYGIAKKHFSQWVADVTYLFYLLFLGFSPQFVTVYTDIMVIPITVLQIHFVMELFSGRKLSNGFIGTNGLFLGLLTALGIVIRPTLIILPLAFFMVKLFQTTARNYIVLLLSFTFFGGIGCWGMSQLRDNQTEVLVHKEYGIHALAFVDLGLTYTGTDQIDFENGLASFVTDKTRVDENYDGRYKTEVVLQDIKRRLKDYTLSTFVGHLLTKQALLVGDGTLGWVYKDASKEGAVYINPLYEKIKDNRFFEFVRKYLIYTDQPDYEYYRYGIQVLYILFIIGVLVQFTSVTLDFKKTVIALAFFGGLLFLTIFEGGKARYLVQFFPQALVLAGLGFERLSILISRYHKKIVSIESR